ncbi:hypothetical protein GGS23DRAFT_557266 [Durotheca rogersii]|uniref:uncharacterized protein n=1 Tax=Durotheca rogersii TaxID=419775 RepID=UPI002220A105|nr:uncharacterized protein GGS23DRAFT_557266 [Durotheca rogersii]KAI5865013.1 hypothetical protein GGS23DRAFT_557266 [Durotheca rogersii]
MPSDPSCQTPSRGSSRGTTRPPPSSQSSSLLVPSATRGPMHSTPSRRHTATPYSKSTDRRQPRDSSRVSSGAAMSSHLSSPQLPPHPRRQRLSLRLPSSRASLNSLSRRSGDDEDDSRENGTSLSSEEADATGEIIMAIDMKDNEGVGCAYYIAADEKLFLLEEVAALGIDLVETLLIHASPTTVLISARASETLAAYLADKAQGVDGSQGGLQSAYILRTLNSADFRYDSGKEKLLGLDLGTPNRQSILYTSVVDDAVGDVDSSDGERNSRQGRLMRLATSINLDSLLTV